MSELPKGWSEQKLSACVKLTKGKKPKILQDNMADGFTPYIDIKAFEFGVIRQYADISSSKLTSIDDILMVWDGARSGLVGIGITGAIGSTIVALKPIRILKKYLYYFLLCKYDYISANHKGTGIPHIDPDILWDIDVPLPPTLNDQKKIVECLELLLDKINKVNKRLEKIPAILKRFRQSVLSSACSGKLTADWREKNEGEEWSKCFLEDLAEKRKNAISSGPFGSALGTKDYIPSGIPIIRGKNIGDGKFLCKDFVYISEQKAIELKRSITKPNDLVIVAVGSSGQAALIPLEIKIAILSQNCNKFSIDNNKALPKFILLFLQNSIGLQQLKDMTTDTARPFLSLTNLKTVEVHLPPHPEQKEIVCRVDKLFALADKVEQQYKNAKIQLARAEKSIYTKAFRGELVKQEVGEQQNL